MAKAFTARIRNSSRSSVLSFDTTRTANESDVSNDSSVASYMLFAAVTFLLLLPSNGGGMHIWRSEWFDGYMKYAVEMDSVPRYTRQVS